MEIDSSNDIDGKGYIDSISKWSTGKVKSCRTKLTRELERTKSSRVSENENTWCSLGSIARASRIARILPHEIFLSLRLESCDGIINLWALL